MTSILKSRMEYFSFQPTTVWLTKDRACVCNVVAL